tara:strand:- start:1652 stop:2047 length:396 start_codon:yes stop_codon:yes gene_type:complete
MINIGQTAKATGLNVKTIRYYGDINLVEPRRHSKNGYRLYDDDDIRKLILVSNARKFDFSLKECRALVELYENKRRSKKNVKTLAQKKLKEINKTLEKLHNLQCELSALLDTCDGDSGSDCPILDKFIEKY